LIAVASLYLACAVDAPTSEKLKDTQPTRYALRPSSTTANPSRAQLVDFFANINVSLELIAYISQQILSMYALWDCISDGSAMDVQRRSSLRDQNATWARAAGEQPADVEEEAMVVMEKDIVSILQRMRDQRDQDLAHPATARPVPVNKILERVH
jgi:cyclin-C